MARQLEEAEETKECSMCGDVGFPEELFRCHTCLIRVQHRYCSRWYLKLSPQAHNWACEWCLSAAVASTKPIMSAPPRSASQLPSIAADDPKSKKNRNKRSCVLDQIHQTESKGAILKRRRQSNSQSIAGEPCRSTTITTTISRGAARRFRSLQDVLCSSWLVA